jgi:hypothetical protein
MNHYEIAVRPRHLRYMFFIDYSYPYHDLLKLIHHNLKDWGGRYNPIVPVKDGAIVDGYIDVIKHYDPDYIFYTKEVNPEIIKKLRFFNPCGFYELDAVPRKKDVLGIDSLYLLSQFDKKSSILMPGAIWKTESPLLSFYQTNFGLTPNGIVSNYEITKDYNQIIIDEKNFSALNEIIHTEKPVNLAHLSGKHISTPVLRNLKHAQYNSFEMIIDGNTASIDDLLYFWNRHLYECHNLIYVTIDQLALLKDDKYFGGVLYDISTENTINVVSRSLGKEEIERIINDSLNKIAFHRRFEYKPIADKFPFEVLDANGLFERDYGESPTIQTLISSTALVSLPDLSFTDKVGYYPQKWAYDTQIKEINGSQSIWLKFPQTTDTRSVIREAEGRINRQRNVSFFIHNQSNGSGFVDLEIPLPGKLFNQLICSPVIDGEKIDTKYVRTGLHDSSNKLSSFIRTFGGSLAVIDHYFTDKFWVEIFESLCTSERAAGDSITFQDILQKCVAIFAQLGHPIMKRSEIVRIVESNRIEAKSYTEILKKWKDILEKASLDSNATEMDKGLEQQGQEPRQVSLQELLASFNAVFEQAIDPSQYAGKSFRDQESVAASLQRMVQSLCDYGVFLPGFKLKCPRCSSIFWYPNRDVNDFINCKGCLQNFTLPIEPKHAYKLSDLIKNNIYQSKTQRDGNLAVLRSLANLSQRGRQGFTYSPQLNVFDSYDTKKPCADIDIVTIVDGEFIIGESKHKSSEFKNDSSKALNSIIEIAKAIRPDKVILSCYEDEHSRLENAKQYLLHHFNKWDYAPEIEAKLLRAPDYFNFRGAMYFV